MHFLVTYNFAQKLFMDQKKGGGGQRIGFFKFYSFFFVFIPHPHYLPKERIATIEHIKWDGSIRHHFFPLPLGSKD